MSYKQEGKPKMSLLDPDFLEQMALLQEYGDEKHKDNHWLEGVQVTDVLDAMERHIHEIRRGKAYDEETRRQHSVAVALGAMYVFHYTRYYPQYHKFSPSSMKDLQELVVRWLQVQYPNRTYQDVLIKFLEEVAEMFKNPNASELGDLMILILDLAHLLNIDLGKATVDKMLINGERKWQIDPETGIMHHVRP